MSAEQFSVFGRQLSFCEQTAVVIVNWILARGLPPNPPELHPLVLESTSGANTQEPWQLAFAPFCLDQEAYFRLQLKFPETGYTWTVERRETPYEFRGYYVKLVPR